MFLPLNCFLTLTNTVGNCGSKVKSEKAAEEEVGGVESLEFIGYQMDKNG